MSSHWPLVKLTFSWKLPVDLRIDYHQKEWNHMSHRSNVHVTKVARMSKLLYEMINFFLLSLLTTCKSQQLANAKINKCTFVCCILRMRQRERDSSVMVACFFQLNSGSRNVHCKIFLMLIIGMTIQPSITLQKENILPCLVCWRNWWEKNN